MLFAHVSAYGEALVRDRPAATPEVRQEERAVGCCRFHGHLVKVDAEQRALFDKALDAYIASAEAQHQELLSKTKPPATHGAVPKRTALPADYRAWTATTSPRTPAARAAVRSSA